MSKEKFIKLETRIKDMFRNHNMNSAIQAMITSKVARDLLRQFFNEYDATLPTKSCDPLTRECHYLCPVCESEVEYNYCPLCGQAIKWEVEE